MYNPYTLKYFLDLYYLLIYILSGASLFMALLNGDLIQMDPTDSINKFTSDADQETIETSWLIDNLPVTVFKVSNESSWPIRYISKNVEAPPATLQRSFFPKDFPGQILFFRMMFP